VQKWNLTKFLLQTTREEDSVRNKLSLEDNIKMDLTELKCEDVNWSKPILNRAQRQALWDGNGFSDSIQFRESLDLLS
jgi:hypothetical protein